MYNKYEKKITDLNNVSFWPVDGIMFQKNPFSSSSNNYLKWQRYISLCTCAPSPKYLDGSAPHVRRSRDHNLMERNPGVKIKVRFQRQIAPQPSDLVQVLWNLRIWNFPEKYSQPFQNKFHCFNFDAQRSALFFGCSRPLMRSLSSPSVILWLEESVLGKYAASLEADGCSSSLFEETVFVVRVHSKIVRRFRNRKSIAMR